MREERLGALRMVKSTVANAATGHSDDESTTVLPCGSFPVAELGSLVDDLIECRIDVIGELYLGDWFQSGSCTAYAEASYALLRQRSVENSRSAKFISKAFGASKDATKSDILAEQDDALVCLHSVMHSTTDRLVEILPFEASVGAQVVSISCCFLRLVQNGSPLKVNLSVDPSS